jgi:hypothetical protein
MSRISSYTPILLGLHVPTHVDILLDFLYEIVENPHNNLVELGRLHLR